MTGMNGHKLEKSSSDMITDEMAVYLYVFGVFMKGRIGGTMNSRLVVTEEKSRSGNRDVKILNQLTQPK